MDKVAVCFCGCGSLPTRGKWVTGHWNRGKKHVDRKKPEFRRSEEGRKSQSDAMKAYWVIHRKLVELNDCACGCGEQVKGKWAWGHHSRVNNISKRADIREKRSEMFHRLHEENRLPNWNRGLTKEDDERLSKCGRPVEVLSIEERRFRSGQMKRLWEEGKIVPLTGPDHPQWNGGTSSITQRVRGNSKLYEGWKRPILKRDGWKCTKCQGTKELVVHHDGERFCDIVRKCLLGIFDDGHKLTWEEESLVVQNVVNYHMNMNVSGITLCWGCHENVHANSEDTD